MSAWAIGMIAGDVRRSSGGASSAIEEPEADGHRGDAERQHDQHVEQPAAPRRRRWAPRERERGAPADDQRDRGGDQREAQRGPDRVDRRLEEARCSTWVRPR